MTVNRLFYEEGVGLSRDEMCDSKANSMAESVTDAIWVAAKSMGYPELRHLQETAVRAFAARRDVFVSSKITERCRFEGLCKNRRVLGLVALLQSTHSWTSCCEYKMR